MLIDDARQLLQRLQQGACAEAAAKLEAAIDVGATLHGPREPIPSAELVDTYRLRLRLMRARGNEMAGYAAVTEMLVRNPDASWVFVGIEGGEVGGAIVQSADGEWMACFAYDDRWAS